MYWATPLWEAVYWATPLSRQRAVGYVESVWSLALSEQGKGGRAKKKLTRYAWPQLGLGRGQLSQKPAGRGRTWAVMIRACQNTWETKNPVRSDNAHCKT